MTKTENAVIKYQIDFEKYKNGQANAILQLLDNANNEIAKIIKQTKAIYTKSRYKEIAKLLNNISTSLKDTIENQIEIDGVIEYELKKQSKLLDLNKKAIKKIKGLNQVNFIFPSVEQIKTSALFKPIDTNYAMTFQTYLNGIENGLYNTWDVAVRTGYLLGLPTKEIVKNVIGGVSQIDKLKTVGSIKPLRNSIYANTRTVLQSLANETRTMIFEENEKYFSDDENRYEYLATLDNRTCLVCGSLDGSLFKNIRDEKYQLPKHRGCRCIVLPYFEIEGDKKSSKNGYVDSKVTFNDWLKEQDEETQLDVLGRTRFNLFKNGESITQFVDNGKVLTLAELKL